jgi:hypothetical protein
MPREREIYADGDTILCNLLRDYLDATMPLLEQIREAEADAAIVDNERARAIDDAKRRQAAGQHVDWAQFFRDHPLRYQFDLNDLRRQFSEVSDGWVKYNICQFAGKELSESEKVVWRQSLRDLADQGLLYRDGTYVRLSERGKEAAIPLLAQRETQ